MNTYVKRQHLPSINEKHLRVDTGDTYNKKDVLQDGQKSVFKIMKTPKYFIINSKDLPQN